jgi:ABC-type multidrug transport system fused ATPase/permease subunit
MTVLYEMTIFVAIALTAITVTVFVIAASLLGRAIEESSRKQEAIVLEESLEFDETIAELQKRLKGAKKASVINDLKKQISDYEEKKKRADEKSKKISQWYGLLTVKGTVLYPGIFFLASIVLAGVARYITTLPQVWVANVVWGLALLALAWGCYRICKCLMVIEGIAITTEEAQFKRTTKALEMALDRHEERKRPKLTLKFKRKEPPFSFEPDVTEKVDFGIVLTRGDVARSAEVWFFAPENFEFPGSRTWQQDSEYTIPNAITTSLDLGNAKGGLTYARYINIKTPHETGEYILGYSLKYEGSIGELVKFKIKVE